MVYSCSPFLQIDGLLCQQILIRQHMPFKLAFLFFLLIACGDNAQVPSTTAATTSPTPVTMAAKPDKTYLLGQFDPLTHPDFEAVGKPYAKRPGMILRKETLAAFQKMHAAAQKDGIVLEIISSTRNFEQQKKIWEGKWTRFAKDAPDPEARALKILEYSSMPGSSRHHWGTDIDLNDLNNATFEAGGKYEKTYQWLVAHAHEYGFCQPYTAGRPHGYHEEKWHWTYTPLSKNLLQQYKENIQDVDIQGFKGAELATKIQIVRHYVLGINATCAE